MREQGTQQPPAEAAPADKDRAEQPRGQAEKERPARRKLKPEHLVVLAPPGQ